MRPGKKILTYVVIFLTAWLSALSYILFVFPNNFAPAGINGLCTMIQYALGIRVSIMNLLVNLPLALLVYKIVSRPVAIRSMIYSASFSLALAVLGACAPGTICLRHRKRNQHHPGPFGSRYHQRILL